VVVKKLDITVLSPLFNLKLVITVLLGYFFLGEILTTRMIFLIGVVVIAGVFATMDERFSLKSFLNKNIMLGIFLMFFASIQVLLINRAMSQNDYWTGMMWMVIMSIIFSFAINFPRFYKDLKKTKIKDYSGVVLLAIFGGLSDLAVYKAYEGNIGISSIIFSLPISMILTLFFVFWKPDLLEKHTVKVYIIRLAATAVMILGAIGLSR
jgi:drug/metabolite transporter (DMT)-like permease